jgi:HlyD family secretion protein
MKQALPLVLVLLLSACGKANDTAWLGYAVGDNAFVAAPMAGWLAKLAVQRGDTVKVGQLLFTLDDTSQTSARDQALAAIALADGQMGEAQASLELARKELARQEGLMRASAGTKQNYDVAKATYDQAVAKVAEIGAQAAQARAALANASYQLSERDVVSRTSGRVEDVFFRAGEYPGRLDPSAAECLCPFLRAGNAIRADQARPEGRHQLRRLRGRPHRHHFLYRAAGGIHTTRYLLDR